MGNNTSSLFFSISRRGIHQHNSSNTNSNEKIDHQTNYWLDSFAATTPTTMTPTTSRLPSCSDEILDWTEDASYIFHTYLQRRKSNKKPENGMLLTSMTVHPPRPERTTTTTTTSTKKTSSGDSSNNNDDNNMAPMLLCAPLYFQPIVLKIESDNINDLSSMNLIDQGKFLTENIIIAVSRGENGYLSGVLKIGHFIKLYRLLTRYVELLTVAAQQQQPEPIPIKPKAEDYYDSCAICLEGSDDDDTSSSNINNIVLPCSHRLCARCYELWVNRNLSCPFCRYEFQRRSEAKQCHWEMLEWSSRHIDQIGHDIQHIEVRLEKFWKKVLHNNEYTRETASSLSEILTKTYRPMKRTMHIREEEKEEGQEEGDIIIVN